MYNILLDNIEIALGLSVGELNQWLIDIDNELKGQCKENFRIDLGYEVNSNENFENYIYNVSLLNEIIRYKENIISIIKL